jgi:FkbM family methyltransferase
MHSLVIRIQCLRHKLLGRLPGCSWMQLFRLLPRSTQVWPRAMFAEPIGSDVGLVLFATPFGTLWAPSEERESLGLTVLEMLGDIYFFGPVQIRRGDTVVDMGTNIGLFTRIALRHKASRVICFEANPKLASCLEKSFAAEIRQGIVTVVNSPVWHEEAEVSFEGDSLTGKVGSNGGLVQAVTLDGTCARLGVQRVDYVKADIEGAERYALKGGRQTLQASKPKMALCVYHLPDDPEVIAAEVLASNAYKTHRHASGDFLYCW